MKENNITPEDIFFTDENIFPLQAYMNIETNKLRISKKTRRKLRVGNEKSNNLISREYHKFNNSIMVYGGIYNEGLGELIFHNENLNSFVSRKC